MMHLMQNGHREKSWVIKNTAKKSKEWFKLKEAGGNANTMKN